MPRIRNGLILGSLNATLTHYVNLETISCEAIVHTSSDEAGGEGGGGDADAPIDSLQWFAGSYDSTPLLTYSVDAAQSVQRKQIDARTLNLSIEFPAASRFVHNNTNYKCCTMRASQIQHCQQFIAVIRGMIASTSSPTNSTRPKPLSLKKMKKIDTSIFAWAASSNSGSDNSSTGSNSTGQMFTALFRFCKQSVH